MAMMDVDMGGAPQAKSSAVAWAEGIRGLYERGEFCDCVFVVGGERFPLHRAMLAAMSSSFGSYLRRPAQSAEEDPMKGMLSEVVPPTPPNDAAPAGEVATEEAQKPAEPAVAGDNATESTGPIEEKEATGAAVKEVASPAPAAGSAPASADASIPVASSPEACEKVTPAAPSEAPAASNHLELAVGSIATAESVRILLSYIYIVGTGAPWEYKPSSAEVNKDILRLARQFDLPYLHEHAARWLAKGLTTGNVVERLVTCDEFGLSKLRQKIIEQLTTNPTELTIVASSIEIMKHPRILQDILVKVASLAGATATAAAVAAHRAEEQQEKLQEKLQEKTQDKKARVQEAAVPEKPQEKQQEKKRALEAQEKAKQEKAAAEAPPQKVVPEKPAKKARGMAGRAPYGA